MIGAIYLYTVGVSLGLFGLFLATKRIALFISANRAAGEFVRFEEQRSLDDTYYYAVIKFEAHDGKTYEFTGGAGHSHPCVAKKYTVLYPPNDPSKAMLYGFLNYWAAPLCFLLLSGGALLAAQRQH
jgi:hypothetical protein